MALNHKRKMIIYWALIILLVPVLAYVASVAINDQTKTTTITANDVFPIYEDTAADGRGITADNAIAGMAAMLDGGEIKAAALEADIIDETKIADNGIDSEHYNDKSIDPEHIALNEGQILVGQATTNQAGAQAIIPNLTIDATADGMDDDNWSGIGISGIASGDDALLQWQIVFYDSSVARWELADATAASGEYPAWGIATAEKDDGEELIVCIRCVVRNEGWTGLTPGAPIYLGETDGLLTETVPTTANDCVQIIGFALSDSEILFDFSRPYQLVQ